MYGFRLVIPKSLKVLFNQSEYRISLKTRNRELAKLHAFKLAASINLHFGRIRMALNFEDEYKAALDLVQSLKIQDFNNHINFLENLYEFDLGDNRHHISNLIDLRKKIMIISNKFIYY